MPTYEYACQKCGEHIEVVQSFSDPPLSAHDGCGGHLKRVFHPVGIVLKGSGFYATDNRSNKALTPSSEKGDKGSDKGGGSSEPASSAPTKSDTSTSGGGSDKAAAS